MQENQTVALSLNAAYAFGAVNGLAREVNDIRNMVIEWDSTYTSSLRRGYILDLFEKHGIFEEFKKQHWAHGSTPAGETKRRHYLRIKRQYEEFLAGHGSEEGPAIEQDEEGDQSQQFAAESDLRDFLAKNLSRIEPGLRLFQTGDRSGIEYPVEGGYIDILAIDQEECFVVIELKLNRGRNKAVGQLLYYMGWVDKNLSKSPCRGMIIAKEISDDLILAVQRVSGISLYRYHLSVAVELVEGKA